MKTILFMIIVVSSFCLSDDIYLKSGFVVKNVRVIDTVDNYIKYEVVPFRLRSYPIGAVDKVVSVPFDSLLETGYDNIAEPSESTPQNKLSIVRRHTYEYPNLNLLIVSAISFGLAYDYFSDASNYGESIDEFKKYGLNTDSMEKQKSRKTTMGIVFLVSGVVSTIIAVERVEIKASPNSLTLNYHF